MTPEQREAASVLAELAADAREAKRLRQLEKSRLYRLKHPDYQKRVNAERLAWLRANNLTNEGYPKKSSCPLTQDK